MGYFESSMGLSSRIHMWPPFQRINSRPQVQLAESLSRAMVFTLRKFHVSPHSQGNDLMWHIKNGMTGADLCDLDYSLMSSEEQRYELRHPQPDTEHQQDDAHQC